MAVLPEFIIDWRVVSVMRLPPTLTKTNTTVKSMAANLAEEKITDPFLATFLPIPEMREKFPILERLK